jgi:hypothetical protein
VEGVSVRLHADRTRWSSNETPTFTFDLQNSGPRDFITFQLQEMGRVEVDGVWYEWTGAGVWTQSPFRPATSYQGMPVTLAGDWRPSQDRSLNTQPPTYRPLQLPPGKHAIRFAVTCRDSHAPSSKSLINTNSMKPEIVVTSNPVEIEITAFDVVPALAATQWGSSVAGVSAQLRSAHFAWTLDDVVTLSASVRNQGREALQVAQSQELGELQVDGVWYHWARETDVKSSSFSSGREYNDIPVTLTTDWQTRDGEPLQLKPSRHTVRFAMIASALGGAGGTPPIRAMSNPVQIDVAPGVGWRAALVKKYMPGYALRTVRRQTGNQESVAEVLVTLSGEEIDLGSARAGWHGVPSVLPPVGSRVSPLLEPGYWRNAKLTALAPLLKLKIATAVEAEEVARLILGLFKGWSSFEDWTLKAEPSEVGWVVTPAYVGPPTQVRYQGPLELIVEDGVLKDVRERAEMPPRQASVSRCDCKWRRRCGNCRKRLS